MTREFIVKEYQTFPYKGAVHEMPELIRCKDCGHWDYADSGVDGIACGECFMLSMMTEDMFFCGLAERKE